jgi:hypothetical protein
LRGVGNMPGSVPRLVVHRVFVESGGVPPYWRNDLAALEGWLTLRSLAAFAEGAALSVFGAAPLMGVGWILPN